MKRKPCSKILVIGGILLQGILPVTPHADCSPTIMKTAPDSRFNIHQDGTVTDNETGLMWKRCSEGQEWNPANDSCRGLPTSYSWSDALASVRDTNNAWGYANYRDWRLPNLKELRSILELSCSHPSLNRHVFPGLDPTIYYIQINIPDYYWSASPATDATDSNKQVDKIWAVNYIQTPDTNNKDTRMPADSAFPIILVR